MSPHVTVTDSDAFLYERVQHTASVAVIAVRTAHIAIMIFNRLLIIGLFPDYGKYYR